MANLIVKSEIKRQMAEYMVSGDVYDKVNDVIEDLLKVAMKRCEANGRRTVQARDF